MKNGEQGEKSGGRLKCGKITICHLFNNKVNRCRVDLENPFKIRNFVT